MKKFQRNLLLFLAGIVIFCENISIAKTYHASLAPLTRGQIIAQKESRDVRGNHIVSQIVKMQKNYILADYQTVTDPTTGQGHEVIKARVANQVIVSLQEGYDETHLRTLAAGGEGRIVKKVYGENSYLVELASLNFETLPRAIGYFESHPNLVKKVGANGVRFPQSLPNDPSFSQQWALNSSPSDWYWKSADPDINAPEAWNITIGSDSVVVGVIDTGIDYKHPDLKDNLWKNVKEIPSNGIDDDKNGLIDDIIGYDFYDDEPNPMDEDGHGTHVSGIIGARGNNSIGVSGVNWKVKIMPFRCGTMEGIYTVDVRSAVNYAIEQGVDILNCSFGGEFYDPYEEEALQKAKNAGILVVCSAGNWSINTDLFPQYPSSAPFDNIIAVTGTDNFGEFDNNFNYGKTSVDLAAPGNNILNTLPPSKYGKKTGTSMAAPMVAGVVALIKSKKPEWNYAKIKQEILESVDKSLSLQNKCLTGGKLNAFKALKRVAQGPVEFVEKEYLAEERGLSHFLKVRRYGGEKPATVQYQIVNGTAKQGEDFIVSGQGTLTFPEGSVEQSLAFVAKKDGVIEGEETFQIKLFNPQGMLLGTQKEIFVTIVDNSPGTIELVQPLFACNESQGKVMVAAVRKGGNFGPASVQYEVNSPYQGSDVATFGKDYFVPFFGTLKWEDGEEGLKTFYVNLIDDAETEVIERTTITLYNVKGAKLNSKNNSTLEIFDNEPTQYFFDEPKDGYQVTEGAEKLQVTVRAKGTLKHETVRLVNQSGTALQDQDFTFVDYQLPFHPWTKGSFPATIPIIKDQIAENDEHFYLKLIPQKVQSKGDTVKVTIKEGSTPGTLYFSDEFSKIAEGDATEFIIRRKDGTDGAVSVDYQITGSAQWNKDYEIAEGLGMSGTVHFASGQKIALISISVFEDDIFEADETITMTLSNPKNGVVLGSPSQSTITIKGGGLIPLPPEETIPPIVPLPGTIQFSAESFMINESAGFAMVTVTRKNGFSGAVSAKVVTSDEYDAQVDVDYTTTLKQVNWASGEGGAKMILIPIINDNLKEGNERLAVFITSVEGAKWGSPDMADLTIIDDDDLD